MINEQNFHAKNSDEVLQLLQTALEGLSAVEAGRRLQIYGANELQAFRQPSVMVRFLRQFHDILIYVLLISAVITLFLGHLVDTGVIVGVVLINAIFGFMQEGKAETALAAIRELLTPHTEVIRDGTHQIIPSTFLVVGDIVVIKNGDKVPADLRLLEVKNLQVQEAILTGESNAVEKNTASVAVDAALGDRLGNVYGGTAVIYGKATGVVIATGANTEIGKISSMLKKIPSLTTPLLRQMNVFGRWLTLAIVVLTAFTFAIGVVIWRDSVADMFMAAVGLAVAAIPEGLPPLLTIILAIGVTRMARRKAIIRYLPAVETMGAVTTICTDKTGTLTRNEQTIKQIVTAGHIFSVEQDDDDVQFSLDKNSILLNENDDLALAINAAILCNEGEFSRDSPGKYRIHGNPIDSAILELGAKAKIDLHLLHNKQLRVDFIPYESEHKFMATLNHSLEGGGSFIYIKGAPEPILARCNMEQRDGTTQELKVGYWQQQIAALANKGLRVIAVAIKAVAAEQNQVVFADVAADLVLVALFGLIDAPRPEAVAAVAECYHAGIKVKMITGDHALTAVAVAEQVGIATKSGVLTGNDIDKLDDQALTHIVGEVNVYARTSPYHKLRLVQALQSRGEVVAMTGDGVNDAPALRKADIGIAMGQKGAEIAKESAAMVLADDNFATIVNAVEEGRIVYDNLKKVILFILPTNSAEALVVVMAVVFGFLLPITPVQILWVNMITAVALATALGFEQAEDGVMFRSPRPARSSILSIFLVWRLFLVAILLVLCVFGLFMLQRSCGVDLNTARTVAVNMLVFGEIAYLLNCRKLHASAWSIKNSFGSKPIMLAIIGTTMMQLLFTYQPTMQRFFGTAAISLLHWVYIIVLSLAIFALVELEKLLLRYCQHSPLIRRIQ